MYFRCSVWVLMGLPLLAGCTGWPFSSASHPGEDASPRETSALQGMAADANVRQAGGQATEPKLDAEQSYGVWLAEAGPAVTWLRLEKPRFHVVTTGRERNLGWVMNGSYAFARDGSVFGVVTEIGRLPETASAGLSWSDERSLRGLPMEPHMLPFYCQFRPEGEGMRIAGFLGTLFKDERDRWLECGYQKVALARPAYAQAQLPMGNWERRPPESRDRLVLNLLPDQVGVTHVDGRAGQRTRLRGECVPAPGGLIFGIFTSVDRALGSDQPARIVPPQAFCLRVSSSGQFLDVREAQAVGLDERIRGALKGEFLPVLNR